jgi:hypothetical protein
MFRGGLLPAQLKRNLNLVVLDCKSCAAAFISAATASSVLLIRNPLRPLCVLSVSAASLLEYLFTSGGAEFAEIAQREIPIRALPATG